MVEENIKEIRRHFPKKLGDAAECMIRQRLTGYDKNATGFFAALKGNLLAAKATLKKEQKPLELKHLEEALKKATDAVSRQ